jgi:uncharacterized protein (TIGR02117 family)
MIFRKGVRSHPCTAVFLILVLLQGCATAVRDLYSPPDSRAATPIYVVSHGWHTGIVVDRKKAEPWLPALRGQFINARYLEIGWGDGAFYQAENPSVWLALQAAFGSGYSVLHVVALPVEPQHYFLAGETVAIRLSQPGFRALVEFINASFYLDDSGNIVDLSENSYGDSRFYRANGRYHLLSTCNNWTAQALQTAGVPIDSATAQTAGSVMRQLEKIALDR